MRETVRSNPFEDQALASAYDQWFDTPQGRLVDRLEKALIERLARPRAGESALDVGTGTGHFACDLAARGLRVVGYDRSEAMLAQARAKRCEVTWQQGLAEELPFSSNTFDLVLSITALEFVEDRARALDEMFRVVAPGGRLVVGVLNAEGPWGRFYRREAQTQDTPFRQAHFYTPDEFVAALSRYGRVRWNSAVFFGPEGVGPRFAIFLERWGQAFRRERGTLLVGRVDK